MRADEPKSAKQFFIVSPFGRSFSPAFLSVLGYVAGRGGEQRRRVRVHSFVVGGAASCPALLIPDVHS